MSSFLRTTTFAGTLALLAGCGYGKTGPGQTVSVRLYDQAQVPAAVLHSAMMEASRLFRAAGIRITWEQPPVEAPEDQGTDMTAAAFRQRDERPYLVIRLMRRTPASAYPGALGYSLPFAQHGADVLIFYDRVEGLTQRVNTAGYVILGHAMAHELGHILLRSSEHSNTVLMQACWTAESWRLAAAGLPSFEREEARRMRVRNDQAARHRRPLAYAQGSVAVVY
ncbi:MAG TPA: hypothetical protein VFB14_04715 [Bryobacteraceae bacterium]|jgi:hypothetical protein|nr:hypothetical protein [Bryobacteraceae bacterium]